MIEFGVKADVWAGDKKEGDGAQIVCIQLSFIFDTHFVRMSEAKYQLEDLIVSLTTTGSNSLDEVALKQIKSLCR